MTPRFSIVIPTWNRARTLFYTLQTCLDQDYSDYEIVVSDNASQDGTREMVQSFQTNRIRYFQTPRMLCLTDSWEFAVSKAQGEYLLLIGSDDGMLPNALTRLDNMIECLNARAIRFSRCYYTWPDPIYGPKANHLEIPIGGVSFELSGPESVLEVVSMRMDYTMLPMLYTAAIHHSLIAELIGRTGRVFWNASPDTYSGIALAYLLPQYYSLGFPVTINGASANSIGFNAGLYAKSAWIREQDRLTKEAGFTRHPRVSLKEESIKTWLRDSFEHAKDHLFPDDPTMVFDYDSGHRNPGFDGQVIDLNCDKYGISDIYQASKLAQFTLENVPVRVGWPIGEEVLL